uniref:LRRCT domain-containing protein n=1 Tax=Bracon brevicornis TaxID=1563983 RepID=A0A6V7IMJ0_9HYME
MNISLSFVLCFIILLIQNCVTAERFPGEQYARLDFYRDEVIAPNSLSTVGLSSLRISFLHVSQKHGGLLKSLTLQTDSFAGLPNLTELYINNANITFDGNPFIQIPTLKTLELVNGALTEVPQTLISALPNLERLSLETNHIKIIPSDIFVNYKHLKALSLRNNGLERLEPGWSNGLEQLEELDLMNNAIPARPDMFAAFRNVKQLFISDAFDPSGFRADALGSYPQLTWLNIDHIKMTSLKPGMFDGSPQLQRIWMDANSLINIPTGVFEKLTSLRDLTFVQNRIETIEPGAFSGLNMSHIGLSNNRITTLQRRTFSGLQVGRLDLGHNMISDLKPFAFNGLKARTVDLGHNRLIEVGAHDFYGLTVDYLDLSANDIDNVAPGAFRNTKIEKLALYGVRELLVKKKEWGLADGVQILM